MRPKEKWKFVIDDVFNLKYGTGFIGRMLEGEFAAVKPDRVVKCGLFVDDSCCLEIPVFLNLTTEKLVKEGRFSLGTRETINLSDEQRQLLSNGRLQLRSRDSENV